MVEFRMSPYEVTADRITYLVVLPDLTYELVERLVNVDPLLRRSLDELAAEVLRKITTL